MPGTGRVLRAFVSVLVVLLVSGSVEGGERASAGEDSARAQPAATGEPSIQVTGQPTSSSPVHPPPGPLDDISRDCGFSVPLSDGNVLWIFCDSSDVRPDGSLSYFVNNTAAIGPASEPTRVREPVDGSGRPYQFIRPTSTYRPCTGSLSGHEHVIWPLSAVAVPGTDVEDRVLVYYSNLCRDRDGGGLDAYTSVSVGLAEYRYRPGDPNPAGSPIRADHLNPRLFDTTIAGRTFGEAAVHGGDGRIYVYRCEAFWGCQVARVTGSLAASPSAYRYWDGGDWDRTTPPVEPTLELPGGGIPSASFNVVYVHELGVYGMATAGFPGFATDTALVRVARSPQGPWSEVVSIRNTRDCGGPGCYAAYLHPRLGSADLATLTFFDADGRHAEAGQVRAFSAGIQVTPDFPGRCRRAGVVEADAPRPVEAAWAVARRVRFENRSPRLEGGPMVVAELDGDGCGDLLDPGAVPGEIHHGDGQRGRSWVASGGVPEGLAVVGDFDGDRRDDVFVRDELGSAAVSHGTPTRGELELHPLAAPSTGKVLVGDFDGDRRDDLLFYVPGGGADAVWFGSPVRGVFNQAPVRVNGSYDEVVVGDLDGDRRDDVLFYEAGSAPDYIWFGQAGRTFSSGRRSVNGTYQRVLVGDFDGDAADDLFFYRPGTGPDYVWFGDRERRVRSGRRDVNGRYRAVVVGDYDADRADDLFFHMPGGGFDYLWTGRADRHFASHRFQVHGTYDVRSADIDGDWYGDLLFAAPGSAVTHIWHGAS